MSTDYKRQQSAYTPCLSAPEVRALNARMREVASEMRGDVEAYMDRFLETSQFPDLVFQRLREFRGLYDRLLQEMIARLNLMVTCGEGCPTCCHVVPCGLEPLEVIEIFNHVGQWPDFKNLMKRSAEAMRAFQKILHDIEQKDNKNLQTGSNAYSQALERFYLLRIPCIFLNQEQGTCRIYDIRPLICRAVFCLSDPAFCDPKHPNFSSRVLEVLEPVDEINLVLIQTNFIISEAMGFRFPEILQHGLLVWHRWVMERRRRPERSR